MALDEDIEQEARVLAKAVREDIASSVEAVTLQSVNPDEASATNSLDRPFVQRLLNGDHTKLGAWASND